MTSTQARTWSPQQEAIFAWFDKSQDFDNPNLTVIARAGTGKTTTILEGINRAPERSILLCAFNKRIAEELTTKLTNPYAEAKTLHALGYSQLRDVWPGIRVAKVIPERAATLTASAIAFEHGSTSKGIPEPPDTVRTLISKLHTLGREIAPHAHVPLDLADIGETFECFPDASTLSAPGMAHYDEHYICSVAFYAMQIAASDEALARRTGIDFADMLYLPVRNGWMTPKYDLVVVDEAQDMTVTQLELAYGVCTASAVRNAEDTTGRFCVVGDNRQAIYAFRGADSASLARLTEELNADTLTLTTTYRCCQAVVREAQTLVPDFTAHESNPEGEVRHFRLDMHTTGFVGDTYDYLIQQASPAREDFILSRKNAPLAKVAMAFLRANKRVRIQGKDIGASLKALAERLTRGSSPSIPKFLQALETWESKEIARAEKKHRPDLAAVAQDKAETLRILADSVTGPAELLARIDGLFSDNGKGQVICSSVHKAKGLEASHVFILTDTLYPKFAMRTEAGVAEESNIAYVAVSRAINSLTYVGGIQ